jgi:hypothetical protein
MSEEELVSAFLDGRISRRVFIRRLMVGGLTAGAALSVAALVGPSAFGAAGTAGAPGAAGVGGAGGSGAYASYGGYGGSGTSGGAGGGPGAGAGG